MGELRVRRVLVYLTAAEERTLRRRAGGRRLSAYLRHLAIGSRPGAAQSADDWWDSLPPGRKEQVHGWVSANRPGRPSVAGEVALPMFADQGAT